MLYLVKPTPIPQVSVGADVLNVFAPSQGAPVPKNKRTPTLSVAEVVTNDEISETNTEYRVSFTGFEPFVYWDDDVILTVVDTVDEDAAFTTPEGHLLVRPALMPSLTGGERLMDPNAPYEPRVVTVESVDHGPKVSTLIVTGSRVRPTVTRWRAFSVFVVEDGSLEVAA